VKIIEKLKNFLKDNLTTSLPIYNITTVLDMNSDLLESIDTTVFGTWIRYEYVFKKPTILYFKLTSSTEVKELQYTNVIKLVFNEYLNVFIDCRIYYFDKNDEEQFYILNDIHTVAFGIGETNERCGNANQRAE